MIIELEIQKSTDIEMAALAHVITRLMGVCF